MKKRVEDQLEQGIEFERRNIESNYYGAHPLKKGEIKVRKEIPTMTVNGKKYYHFESDPFTEKMVDKKYRLDEKTLKLFEEYNHNYEKLVASYYLLDMDKGEKGLVHFGLATRLNARNDYLREEIKKAVKDNFDNFLEK
ncbi:MAG: hypothetical protein K6B41_12725 [Butyrivibrio sp.]|nr:hypothetical protein [Butyrivibrio sp.]